MISVALILCFFFCSSDIFNFLSVLTTQNKRRREEEEYYASQQAGYVAPPPEKKKKWYQKFRRNKKKSEASAAAPVQEASYDNSMGGDFSQMQDEDDRSTGNGSMGGWSARSFGTRSYA